MRVSLPPRRPGVTLPLRFATGSGNILEFSASYGYGPDGRIREAFCLPFKSGTDLESHIHQDCMIISIALQHGATMASIAHTIGEDGDGLPRAIPGLIVRVGAMLDMERELATAEIHEFPKPATEVATVDGLASREPMGGSRGTCQAADAEAGLRAPADSAHANVSEGVTAGRVPAPSPFEEDEADPETEDEGEFSDVDLSKIEAAVREAIPVCYVDPDKERAALIGQHKAGLISTEEFAQQNIDAMVTAGKLNRGEIRLANDFEIPDFLRRQPERSWPDMRGIVE